MHTMLWKPGRLVGGQSMTFSEAKGIQKIRPRRVGVHSGRGERQEKEEKAKEDVIRVETISRAKVND